MEFFVDADRAASFLSLSRKHVLKLARTDNTFPAHPFGTGARKTWRFRISELENYVLGLKQKGPDNADGRFPNRKGNR